MVVLHALVTAIICIILAFPQGVSGQLDPTVDFCHLYGHRTAIVDSSLYIDGGIYNRKSSQDKEESSSWLLYANLSNHDESGPRLLANLSKPSEIPSLNGGTLWPDPVNKMLYLWGGVSIDFARSRRFWRYDILYDTWNSSDLSSVGNIDQPAWGAGTYAAYRFRGYYYGGYVSLIDSTPAVTKMMEYDMNVGSFRYTTGPDDIPRAEGVLVNMPVSDAGALIYLGGIVKNEGGDSIQGQPMNETFIYDQASAKWYKQIATGDVPTMRKRSCAGVVWAQDRSSYNIYLVGGLSISNNETFNDVYILSIPSFTWIKFWPRDGDNQTEMFPRHSAKCEVIKNAQMLVIGGTSSDSSTCDTNHEIQNLDLGQANKQGAKWAAFNPNISSYSVPSAVIETIGGGPTGGATVTAPTRSWDNQDLAVYFARAYTPTARTPTRNLTLPATPAPTPSNSSTPITPPAPPKSTNRAAKIGGAVGGAIGGLALLAAIGACFFLRRRRKAIKSNSVPELETTEPEKPAELRASQSPTLAASTPLYELPVFYELAAASDSRDARPPHEPGSTDAQTRTIASEGR